MEQIKIVEMKGMFLLPPSPDKCQKCGIKHEPGEPHDNTSLYYQLWFYRRWNRYPIWADAIEHCAKPVRDAWEKELRRRGEWK